MSSQFSDSISRYILNRISKDLEFSILQTGSLFLKKFFCWVLAVNRLH